VLGLPLRHAEGDGAAAGGQVVTRLHRKPSDTRTCWDCSSSVTLPGVDDINKVEREARRRGWKWLEYRGRMLCPDCAKTRRGLGYVIELEDLPF